MIENISLSFQGIWGHKMRSFLTMLGIIIGIASIITIVSTIQGTNEQIKENLIGAGNNVVTVALNQNGSPLAFDTYSYDIPDTVAPITEEVRKSLDKLDGVQETSLYRARTNLYYTVYYDGTEYTGNLYGIDQHYLSVYGYQVIKGRGFSDKDFEERRKSILVDNKVASYLFGEKDPIGQMIMISEEPYTVVGVVTIMNAATPKITSVSDYDTYTDHSSGYIFIPDTTWPIAFKYDEPQSVAVKATSTDDMTKAGKAVAAALQSSQISDTTGTYTYVASDLLQQAANIQALSQSTNSQLIWIAGISLLVGGIGVMNIMLVSITERTREIGLKKALGARKSRILSQFLTEAAVLTSLGGVLGVGCGIGLSQMMSKIMDTPVAISIPACLIAVLFSMAIGIIFGLMPAMKAAKLNPIDALRYE